MTLLLTKWLNISGTNACQACDRLIGLLSASAEERCPVRAKAKSAPADRFPDSSAKDFALMSVKEAGAAQG
jgi:hypothetical protein